MDHTDTTAGSIAAVICAAGSSHRMGGVKKEYCPLGQGTIDDEGRPLTVLGAATAAFAASPRIALIVIVVPPGAEKGEFAARTSLPARFLKPDAWPRILFVPGGSTRRVSVHHALSLLFAYQPGYVLIHDGARPWVDADLIERTIDAVIQYKAVIPLTPLIETPKELDDAGFVRRHLRRKNVGTAQTPQGFAFPDILAAHEKAAERELGEQVEYTDDAEVWGEFAGPVAVIPGSPGNRKITVPEDLGSVRSEEIRVGLGRDLHRLVEHRRFLLGGVELVSDRGELGHSDGDVLTHAVIDALLGAAGLGDIGEQFPPSCLTWKDADSMELLKTAFGMVQAAGWRLNNLDCVVSCEKPRILPYRERIRTSLAKALEVSAEVVFVKGKTNEGLGPLGAGLAVEAIAVCLLERTHHNGT
ncbi:MAG: 2-C-methyl-D-erythritol 2,4-cyclodiphosphate synthase [Treponema sp.]|jgi:2-C-methyl-D-erythritol 2,4-cyclodiphosphate synthase/2-C-methyl-D-erythritol 4-phosphate cytidylyltransferase|nr:2-C-methyl-D-erythritol 2,4-cyclodiphosphate synthase [Treponema sp.]